MSRQQTKTSNLPTSIGHISWPHLRHLAPEDSTPIPEPMGGHLGRSERFRLTFSDLLEGCRVPVERDRDLPKGAVPLLRQDELPDAPTPPRRVIGDVDKHHLIRRLFQPPGLLEVGQGRNLIVAELDRAPELGGRDYRD